MDNLPNVGDEMLHLPVPTSTAILLDQEDPFRAAVIEQSQKHKGRLTCVGGKKTGGKSHQQCIFEECREEVGGGDATFDCGQLFVIKTDYDCDVREVTLGRATDNHCPLALRDMKVMAHYGSPDYVYRIYARGTLLPKDGEAKSVRWIDVRDIRITETPDQSKFGAQHDLVLVAHRLQLEAAQGRTYSHWEAWTAELFASVWALRKGLIRLQHKFDSWVPYAASSLEGMVRGQLPYAGDGPADPARELSAAADRLGLPPFATTYPTKAHLYRQDECFVTRDGQDWVAERQMTSKTFWELMDKVAWSVTEWELKLPVNRQLLESCDKSWAELTSRA